MAGNSAGASFGDGWLQPNEVSHWAPLLVAPNADELTPQAIYTTKLASKP